MRSEQSACLAWLDRGGPGWQVPSSLRSKVGEDGSLLPFFGDTVTVPVDEGVRSRLLEIQRALRRDFPSLLAAPLDPRSFHVTLRDLTSGSDPAAVQSSIEQSWGERAARCAAIVEAATRSRDLARMRLRATSMYPSSCVSLVVGLMPASETEWRALMSVHALFDDLAPTETWPRWHVTLDYLQPRVPSAEEIRRLSHWLRLHNPPDLDVVINLTQLHYERFTDMNHYT